MQLKNAWLSELFERSFSVDPHRAAKLNQQKRNDEWPADVVKALVSDAFINSPNTITDNIIHSVRDRSAGMMVAAQLV